MKLILNLSCWQTDRNWNNIRRQSIYRYNKFNLSVFWHKNKNHGIWRKNGSALLWEKGEMWNIFMPALINIQLISGLKKSNKLLMLGTKTNIKIKLALIPKNIYTSVMQKLKFILKKRCQQGLHLLSYSPNDYLFANQIKLNRAIQLSLKQIPQW